MLIWIHDETLIDKGDPNAHPLSPSSPHPLSPSSPHTLSPSSSHRCRQCQLEELQTLALQFHEAVEPLGEWLSATERRLSTAEPMGTQTSKITQQITKHKVTCPPRNTGCVLGFL